MQNIHADAVVSVTELKKNPSAVLEQSEGLPVAILNHNKLAAYLVPVEAYEILLEAMDDMKLAKLVKQRAKELRVKVNWDEL